MKRALTFVFAGLLMFVVAVLAAFASMRLAIHGREIDVPSLAGLSDSDAAAAVHKLGLDLSVENRFYSAAVAPNHVLSQSPAAGALVRRGSQVRVTESLGGQQAMIPDVIGQTERSATVMLRRMQLDLGATARLPADVPEGMVLAQSPPANATGIAGPRLSILVAQPELEASQQAYIMPQIVGMTLAAANARLSSVGLHIGSAQDPQAVAAASPDPTILDATADPAIPPTVVTPIVPGPDSVIGSQSPAPGHRVSHSDAIRVTVVHTADPIDPPGVANTPLPSTSTPPQ